jgi:ribonucleoside-diphosphate reductase alpha chain
MPNSADYEDVKGAYMLAWKSAVKAVALYRDGSKLSQPLSSFAPGTDPLADAILALERTLKAGGPSGSEGAAPEKAVTPADNPGERAKPAKVRKPLPYRRNGYTQKAKIGGHSIFIRTGEYADGALGEIFLDMHKEGAAFRSLLNSFAIAVSLGLQYGVPLDEYVDAFTFSKFEPNGVVQGHDYVKMATSVIDYIFRDLGISYLKRTDLGQVKREDLNATGTRGEIGNEVDAEHEQKSDGAGMPPPLTEEAHIAQARIKGYTGDPCPVCGSFTLVRNGTCMKCDTCGGTTGCS